MAITKIWPVKSHLGELLKYVGNKDKTEVEVNPEIMRLIGYDTNEYKTEQRLYVTGVNCTPEDAPEAMTELLGRNDNGSDRVAYHAVQSFDGRECDPSMAHAIGVEYACRMWGDNFAVVVATHRNTQNVHNHYAICATGFDGKRFHEDGAMRHRMMDVNDELCRKYGLSVCENRAWGHKQRFVDKKMKERGLKSYREQLRDDIDQAVYEFGKLSYDLDQFFNYLGNLGYVVEKRGKYWRARPDEGERFIRFDSLGKNYSEQEIKARLFGQYMFSNEPKRTFVYKKRDRATGLYGLYLHYQYLLGNLPKTRTQDMSAYTTLREDARKARKYSDEADLLGRNHINTADDLQRFTDVQCERLQELRMKRQKLRNKLRRLHDSTVMQPIKDEISALSKEIKEVSYSVTLAKDIAERSEVVLYVSSTFEYEQECARDKTYADRHAAPEYPYRAASEKWLAHRDKLDEKWEKDYDRIDAKTKPAEPAPIPFPFARTRDDER